ncbi:uncharacterized protein Z520_05028 [Fonsecaea multimorphosa CBS 102226]|uniref:Uncharacterized protein n=1 Tax=Fonsecaea multimorphosa CBS 102226 TaxID=1442371 RepID=A0A0D2K0Z4_9EURO|nr:uncharacterized protein Z520_05028 [Fonsecaea multimorphosa CBS 102226]KIX99452.1 hypothetical protein Z520_05028 [Fonsecaea multimorphosa CBS 102226]OAL25777.1 hypothetical protein AYO22_04766 [Fonsecaea multimorphosa]
MDASYDEKDQAPVTGPIDQVNPSAVATGCSGTCARRHHHGHHQNGSRCQQPNRRACNSRCHRQSPRPCQCYQCQKSRGEPTLHPAIRIPLAIATGGLSCTAMVIYRGYAGHRALKRSMNAGLGGAGQEELAVGDTGADREKEAGLYSVSSKGTKFGLENPEDTGSRVDDDAVSGIDASLPADAAPPTYSEVEGDKVASEMAEKM